MPNVRCLAILVASLLFVSTSGCGGGDGGTTTPPPTPGTLAIAATPAAVSVQAGSSGSTTIAVTRGGGFTGAVALSVTGAPAGVSATLESGSLASSAANTTLSVAVALTAVPGTYTIAIQGTGTNVTAASATLTLTVTDPPVPDFNVELATTAFSVEEGDSVVVPVRIVRIGGYAGTVGLFATGSQAEVTARVVSNLSTDTTATLVISVALGAVPGTYPFVLNATESGGRTRTANFTVIATAKASAGALTLTPSSIGVTQTVPSAPIVVRLARPNGVTGPATLSLELNAASRISGVFSPNPMTGDSAQLIITPTLLSPAGVVTIRVRADVGGRTSTADLRVSTGSFVPPDFSVNVTPSVGTVTAGDATTAEVRLTRVNLSADVNLTVTGAPAGMTATVTPSPIAEDSARLTVTTTNAVAPGVYSLVVVGTAQGITGQRSATYTLTVNAPGGGGNVQWQFCDAARVPLWFATRAGTSGAWTQVTGAASGSGVTFGFPFAQDGQVAYVLPSGGGFNVTVLNVTTTEIAATATSECLTNPSTVTPAKSISGNTTNLINSLRGAVVIGGGARAVVPNNTTAFTLTGVREGPIDVLAYQGVRDSTGFFTQFDRIILRRDLNPPSGATLADFDFGASSNEWLFTQGGNQTFQGFGTDSFTIQRSYITANGNIGTYQIDPPDAISPRGLTAIPTAQRRVGDLHQLIATTTNPLAPRSLIAYESGLSSPAVTFGPLLDMPTVSVLGSAPVRLRAMANWQTEYRLSVVATFNQSGGATPRAVVLRGSADFFAAAAGYSLEIPDFSGAPGWNPIWMLQSGSSANWTVTATGLARGGSATPADNVLLVSGTRLGTVTP